MFDEEEYGSDSSDDDYVPVENADGGSEEESGEEEDIEGLINDASEDTGQVKDKKRVAKKTKKKEPSGARKRQGGIKLEGDEEMAVAVQEEAAADVERRKEMEAAIEEERKAKREEEEKKKADSLWASFMSDMPSRPTPKPSSSSGLGSLSSVVKVKAENKPGISTSSTTEKTESKPEQIQVSSKPEKITITKEFDFAGEMIKVTKEVASDSKEARDEEKLQEKQKKEAEKAATSSGPSIAGLKRPGGGLGGVLGKIGKKPKMGTLEKSRLDWNAFKEKEGIAEELQTFNRGKAGFIERQAFLNRADQRQFELERQVRQSSKR